MKAKVSRIAFALTCAGLSSCVLTPPQPMRSEEMLRTGDPAPAHIAFSYPQIFSRERLINDRFKEEQYLDAMLKDSVTQQFTPQLRRDLSAISSIAAQFGISLSPATRIDFDRAQELDTVRNEIELMKLRAELARIQAAFDAMATGGSGPGAPSSLTAGSASAIKVDMTDAKAQLDTLAARAKETIDKLSAVASGATRATGVTQSPEDRFRDLQAYRARLRGALNEAKLDDVHDRDGNALYRMQFGATVFPGADPATDRRWGIAKLEIKKPKLTHVDIQRIYLRWLGHMTERLNIVDRAGKLTYNPGYFPLVNSNTVLGAILTTTNIGTPPPERAMLIAVNPDYIGEIKWMLLDKRHEKIMPTVNHLKRYLAGDKSVNSDFRAALDSAIRDTRSAYQAAIDANKTPQCRFFENTSLDGAGFYSGGASFTTLKDLFATAPQVALIHPFLQTGMQSGINISTEYRHAAARDRARRLQPRLEDAAAEKQEQDFQKETGFTEFYLSTVAAGDHLWTVEQLYERAGCTNELKLLANRFETVEVPCAFESALLDKKEHTCAKRARVAQSPRSAAPPSSQAAKEVPAKKPDAASEDPAEKEAAAKKAAEAAAAKIALETKMARDRTDPDRKVELTAKSPEELLVATLASGDAVVYSVSPGEQAQRVSTVASAANSAQMALGLAASFPSAGTGLQAGVGHMRAAAGNADALERLPLIVAFSEPGNPSRAPQFGWVFGPQSYIKTSDGDPRVAFRHVVTNHQVAVDVSVPVWWPKVQLELTTEWVTNDMKGPAGYVPQKTAIEMNRPISLGDLDTLTGYLLRTFPPYAIRPVRIDRVEPSRLSLCDGEVTLLIYGVNLWRNPKAFLLGREAVRYATLPDMQGISADFYVGGLQPYPIADKPLVVWTQGGVAEHAIEVQPEKIHCLAKVEAKAPTPLKIVVEPELATLPVQKLELKLPQGDPDWPNPSKLTAKVKGLQNVTLTFSANREPRVLTVTNLDAKDDASRAAINKALEAGNIEVEFGLEEAKEYPAIASTLKVQKKPAAKPPATTPDKPPAGTPDKPAAQPAKPPAAQQGSAAVPPPAAQAPQPPVQMRPPAAYIK